MISVYNSVLAVPGLTQGALASNGAHAGATVDTALFGNMFRSIQFVISAQTITDGTHTFSAQESAFSWLVTLGTQTTGSFTLTWNGLTTPALPFNASAATVLAALVALGGGAANWNVTGSAGGPYTVTAPYGAVSGSGALLTTPGNFGITSGAVGAFVAVDPTRLQGAPVLTSANSNGLFAFGVHHTLRYVQLVDTIAGGTTGGLFSAVALGGAGGKGPVARA
jgi:hypothetical protein